ncbi:MAG: hypothetical protein IKO10_07230 [Lachnospiraceae bacterium]|nr:hypothetical protein [Lachnospiraceae bacterium]
MGDYRELMIEDVQQMVEESINPELIGFVNEKIIDAARNGNTTVEGRIRLLDYKFDVLENEEKPDRREISKQAKALKLYYERRGFEVSIFKDSTGEFTEIDIFWDYQEEQKKNRR